VIATLIVYWTRLTAFGTGEWERPSGGILSISLEARNANLDHEISAMGAGRRTQGDTGAASVQPPGTTVLQPERNSSSVRAGSSSWASRAGHRPPSSGFNRSVGDSCIPIPRRQRRACRAARLAGLEIQGAVCGERRKFFGTDRHVCQLRRVGGPRRTSAPGPDAPSDARVARYDPWRRRASSFSPA
jgi:hypothetical protein